MRTRSALKTTVMRMGNDILNLNQCSHQLVNCVVLLDVGHNRAHDPGTLSLLEIHSSILHRCIELGKDGVDVKRGVQPLDETV